MEENWYENIGRVLHTRNWTDEWDWDQIWPLGMGNGNGNYGYWGL